MQQLPVSFINLKLMSDSRGLRNLRSIKNFAKNCLINVVYSKVLAKVTIVLLKRFLSL